MFYYRKHIGDYLTDTLTLTVHEHGVYNLLLDYYYAQERPISHDDALKRIRPGRKREKDSVLLVLNRYFEPAAEGSAWRHRYADRLIAESRDSTERNREHANKRWGEARKHGAAPAAATPAAGKLRRKPAADAAVTSIADHLPAACQADAAVHATTHADGMPSQEPNNPIDQYPKNKKEREAAALAPPGTHARDESFSISSSPATATTEARPAAVPASTPAPPPQRRPDKPAPTADAGTRLPEGWTVPAAWQDEAAQLRLGCKLAPINVEREAANFADYWIAKPGADGYKNSWHAVWRQWVRNSRAEGDAAGGGGGGGGGCESALAWEEARAANKNNRKPAQWTYPHTEAALRAMGGFYRLRDMNTADYKRWQGEFEGFYREVAGRAGSA